MSKAEKTWSDSEELQGKYKDARERLNETLNKVDKTKERAMHLSKKALDLFEKVNENSSKISDLQDRSQDTELSNLENQLRALIDKMNSYTKKLENKVEFYNNC